MRFPPDPYQSLTGEPEWPADLTPDRPVVVLFDAGSTLERRVIEGWVQRHAPSGSDVELIRLARSRRRRRGDRTDPRLAARFRRGDNPVGLPVRTVWLASETHGRRTANWWDVIKLGDPRDPDPFRQHVILARSPERLQMVLGETATAAALLDGYESAVEAVSLTEWVTRRAWLALERAERAVRGNRYKIPKFVHEEILSRPEFTDECIRIGAEQGLSSEVATARARYYLREIAASHSPFVIDLIANAIHWLYRQGYGSIVYDPEQVAEVARLGGLHSIAFLPSHRSNLDRLALQYLLWENDLPPNHTAAGINMNFFPVGPLIRRTGAFFIRRSFRDNPLYKHVLRSYLDYLVEKRFPLEWYMEGGRSRSGKLMPPRYGILGWVADSVQRGKADDLYLIPATIVYDQIQDVADYASEARGGSKKKESFGWAFSAIRSLRRRYGNIHVRFAEALSVSKEVPPGVAELDIEVQKLAFEVMYRISRITPVTPTSVVSIAMLSDEAAARTADDLAPLCDAIADDLRRRWIPMTEPFETDDAGVVGDVLDRLAEHGSVSRYDGRDGILYHLDAEQAHHAAYYRNVVVHYFVPGAIAELAALASERATGDRIAAFWEETFRLRDLLKFEFFFSDKERFRDEVESDLGIPAWESMIREGRPWDLIEASRLKRAHWAVLPFLEAYQVTADELAETIGEVDEKAFLDLGLRRAEQYRLQHKIRSAESASLVLIRSSLQLARNRGLLSGDASAESRRSYAAEIADVRRRAEQIGDSVT